MEYEEARHRLLAHAGLTFGDESPIRVEETFTCKLRKTMDPQASANVRTAYEDIVACLEAVNRYLNTTTPSEALDGKQDRVDRRLACAVASIIGCAWEACLNSLSAQKSNNGLADLVTIAWAISDAWLAVLHGDFDSIRDAIDEEARSRHARGGWQ